MQTPVVLIIFNRPSTTERVFEAVRAAKPAKLFIVADGPRLGQEEDIEKCVAARKVVEQVDWECEVFRNYSDINLGCGLRPATGISWVFNQVEEAIILEDDCLPHPSFFQFCEELLKKYRDDTRIMHISGNNFQFGRKKNEYSYYFSRYPHIWGWATWRRAWNLFDFEVDLWEKARDESWLVACFNNQRYANYWQTRFEGVYGSEKSHIWDYQWTFTCLIQNGLSINPNVNLVSNIGSGQDASHTSSEKHSRINLPAEKIVFPLVHPAFIFPDSIADNFTQETIFSPTRITRAKDKISSLLKAFSIENM